MKQGHAYQALNIIFLKEVRTAVCCIIFCWELIHVSCTMQVKGLQKTKLEQNLNKNNTSEANLSETIANIFTIHFLVKKEHVKQQ